MKSHRIPYLRRAALVGMAFAFSAATQAATYNWIGTTSDFDEPSNWVENAWTQWGDYRFGSSAISGAVNLDAFFGGGNWFLESGLANDITVTGTQPLISESGLGNGGSISIDTASRDLDIQAQYISFGPVTWNVGAGRALTMTGTLDNWYGAASLIKQGSGTAILKSANGYTGGTTLSGGTLRLENIDALGSSLGMTNGTTLQLRSDTDATFAGGDGLGGLGNASITIDVNQLTSGSNRTLTFATGGFDTFNTTINATGGNGYSLALGGINNGFNSSLALAADTAALNLGYIGSASPVASLTVGGASNTTVTGAVNTGSLTKNDAGTLTFSGTVNNTGATTVSGGILSLGSAALDDGATVVIGSGAKLDLNFIGNDTVGSLSINGSGPLPADTYNSSHGIYGSYFTGDGSLVVLAQDGTWTSLVDGNWSTPANWAGNILASGIDNTATFNAATGVTVTLDSNRIIGNLAFDVSDYTLAGPNTLTLDSYGTPAISVTNGRTATISASLAGTLGIEKTGDGALVLTAATTFSGETLVTNGSLQLGAGPASNPQFGALENSALLTIQSGAMVQAMGANAFKGWSGGNMDVTLNGGTLTLNDGITVGGNHNLGFVTLNGGTISGVGNPNFGGFNLNGPVDVTENSTISATNTNTNGGTLTITVSDGKTLDWSGTITNGYLNAITSLVFEGTGTTVLSGLNTYTGNTTINEGTVELADNARLTFAVTDVPSSTRVTGSGTATFKGDFTIDATAVAGTTDQTWLLVDRDNLTGESFDPATFNVIGFTQQGDGVTWLMSDAKGDWSFSEDTGELTLVVGSDYDTWKSDNGVTGAPTDDDDNDGLSNQEEYAFGLNPTSGVSLNPIVVPLDPSFGTFSYTRRLITLSELEFSVWYSTDLSGWTKDAGATEGTPVVNGDVETVPVTLTSSLLSNPTLFIQVRAQ